MVLRHTCQRKPVPADHRGWAWCKRFRPPLLVLCYLLILGYTVGWGREMVPDLSFIP